MKKQSQTFTLLKRKNNKHVIDLNITPITDDLRLKKAVKSWNVNQMQLRTVGNISYRKLSQVQGDNFKIYINADLLPKLFNQPIFYNAVLDTAKATATLTIKDTDKDLLAKIFGVTVSVLDEQNRSIKNKETYKNLHKEAAASKPVFLELKKKIGGIVAKRRAILPYSDALEFVRTGIIPKTNNYQDNQVLCEIKEFLVRNKVNQKVFISYERVAYFKKDDSEFRVSFDRNILTRRSQVNLSEGDFGAELLENDHYLMEIKCAGQIPLWLCNLMSEMKIYCTSFSKYGTEYKNFCQKKNLLSANQTDQKHLYRTDSSAESVIINALSAVKTAI